MVQADGPRVSPSALRTIGVYDQGSCWGVWIFPSEDPMVVQPQEDGKPHLLLSSIPPSSWPYVFRAQLRLAHHPGAMTAAAEVFVSNGVNILFAECTESGFHHATWNIIGEALSLKEETTELYETILRAADLEERKRHAARITQELLRYLPDLMKSIHLRDEQEQRPFLRVRFKVPRLCSYEENYFTDPTVWHDNQGRISKQVTYSVLPNLTHFFRHGADILNPIRFHYDERREILTADDAAVFNDEIREKGLSVPSRAMASFDTDEHTMRVHFFEKERMSRILHINIDYRMKLNTPQHPQVKSSMGVIKYISRAAADVGLNLINMRNSMTKQDRGSESGYFDLLGEVDGYKSETLARIKSRFEQMIRDIPLPELILRDIRINTMALPKVFLSMHILAARAKTVKRVIFERAERLGVEIVWCETDSETVTENVVRQMRECSGFIQVLSHRQGYGQELNAEWLTAEYFGAIALRLTPLRFVDTSIQSVEQWRTYLRVAADRPLHPFDSREDDEDLENALGSKLDRFLMSLADRPEAQPIARADG